MGSIVNPNNYPAKENVLTIIMVSLTWIIFGIFIPDEYLFYSIEIFILALILTSYFYKNILDILILSFILIVLAISYYLIYPDELYQRLFLFRTAAFSAFIMMGFVLSIGPLSRISDTFLALYKYRRHLGVSVFFLGALHASQVISFYDDIDISNLISSGDFAALGVITLSGLSFLSFTSWDYMQKRIYPLFFDIIHILWTAGVTCVIYLDFQEYGAWADIEPYSKQLLYPILIIFPILTFRFSLVKILLKSIMPWKQLHILSWIIFLFQKNKHQLLSPLKEKKNYKPLIIASVLGPFFALSCWILGYAFIEKPSVTSIITQTSVVFIVVLSWLFLKEKLTRLRIVSTIFVFIGVILATVNF